MTLFGNSLTKKFILFMVACAFSNVFAQQAVDHSRSFGIHIHDLGNLQAAAESGFGSLRLWDSHTAWRDIQPTSNQFKLETLARATTEAENLGLSVTLTLGSTPLWASSRPTERCAYGFGCAAEPANLNDWRRYVQVVANTFRGKIECYEPWNEVSFPSDPVFLGSGDGGEKSQFYSGTVFNLVAISKIAYEEIKKVDPKACVLSPSIHPSGDWIKKLDQYLKAGGGQYMDALSFHFYYGDEPEESRRNIRAVRATLNRYGYKSKQIWNTEVGIPFYIKEHRFPSIDYDDLVFALVLRTYLVNFSEGISRVYWYAWDNTKFGLSSHTRNGGVGGDAITAAIEFIGTSPQISCTSDRGLWRCNVKSGSKTVVVTWITKEAKPSMSHSIILKQGGKRWGRTMEVIAPGSDIVLDGRPVLIW